MHSCICMHILSANTLDCRPYTAGPVMYEKMTIAAGEDLELARIFEAHAGVYMHVHGPCMPAHYSRLASYS